MENGIKKELAEEKEKFFEINDWENGAFEEA